MTRSASRLLVVLAMSALVAASCSSDDDSDGPTPPGDYSLVRSDIPEPLGDPVYGGRLVYALEADTATPWTPAASACAISCHMVMRAIYDPLTIMNADAEVEGFLAESFEPNDDFTSWTFTARPDISFHDGTPFDGRAMEVNLQAHLDSTLTSPALREVTGLSSDGMSMTVTFDKPWPQFPLLLSGQAGYQASPTWLEAVVAGTADATEPVGTGPFRFVSYEAGNQAVFVAERNDDYWIEGLPYLDEIEFRALPNGGQRLEGVQSGQIDIALNSGEQIADARGDDSITLIENRDFSEVDYVLLNVSDPDSPLGDVRVRRAMAMAIDRVEYSELATNGVDPPANGPFNPSASGYLADTGYPGYDPDGARALVDEYEAEHEPISIAIKTTTDPANADTIELIRSQWSDVGIESSTDEVPQNAFIVQAAAGNFEAFLWRNHAGAHPDLQNHWWHGDVARGDTLFKINFGRIDDPVLDGHLDDIRTATAAPAVAAAAEEVSRRFGEQVYNLWLAWTTWSVMATPEVQNITQMALPSGNPILPFSQGFGAIGGSHWLAQIWKAPA